MPEIVRILRTTGAFNRAINRHIGKDAKRRLCLFETLLQMIENPRNPMLETHALRGGSKGLLSCSCGYDCRIIFRFEPGPKPDTQYIVLLDVGTHDEVY